MTADGASGRIHFVIEGPRDAPAVLLAHALGATLQLWDAQAEALARRFTVIRFDLRGHGKSSVPAGDYTLDDLGADAVAVLDAAGVDVAHVAGISLGGLIALWLGINVPSRVRSLFVANSAARVGTVARWEERMALVRREGVAVVASRAMETWFTPEFAQSNPADVEHCRAMIAGTPPVGYLGCCAALRDADLRSQLHAVSAPTLVLAGRRDVSSTVEHGADVAGAIPRGRFVELSGAHMSLIEERETMTRYLGEWLVS